MRFRRKGPRLIAEARPSRRPSGAGFGHRRRCATPSSLCALQGRGRGGALRCGPDAVDHPPSLLFGPGDSFFNRFAALGRLLPVLPLAGAETRFQPVLAGDVAEAIARAIDGEVAGRADL